MSASYKGTAKYSSRDPRNLQQCRDLFRRSLSSDFRIKRQRRLELFKSTCCGHPVTFELPCERLALALQFFREIALQALDFSLARQRDGPLNGALRDVDENRCEERKCTATPDDRTESGPRVIHVSPLTQDVD
jgi:hypothetical protein